MLTDLIKDYQDVGAYQIASIYGYRGEIDMAFEWLDRAYRQRNGGLEDFLMTDHLLKSLHSDPRWGAFLIPQEDEAGWVKARAVPGHPKNCTHIAWLRITPRLVQIILSMSSCQYRGIIKSS